MANYEEIKRTIQACRLQIEAAQIDKPPSVQRSIAYQIAAHLLAAQGLIEGAQHTREPIDASPTRLLAGAR